MSEESKNCPKCGAPIPENAPEGLCPKCLLLGANTDTEPGYTSTMRIPKPAAPAVDELAAAFPQFEILELIGQGGMGYVYKARQQRLDRVVALKILPESLAKDPAFAERFSREGRLLAKLNHPNIVTVHDFGVMDPAATMAEESMGQETVATAAPKGDSSEPAATVAPTNRYYFLVMEYIDGANLRQAMQAGRFTPEQALNVVPKVCDALQYAHDEGVLHRDIKPENILVDTKGRVKIADFGIAKMVDAGDAKAEATLTGEGSTLGTPHYMAPEQIEQPSKVDHRADIYSLGVVFYEMLTGELPIGRFAPPSEKTSVTVRVDEIVFRALEKERELRQQSATEIKTAVESAATQPPPLKQPRGEVVKTAQCFLTMPEYLSTFKARFSHPFTAAGDVILERDRLVFTCPGSEMVFKFENIRDVSVGQMDWWSQKEDISVIAITLEGDGIQRTFLLRPTGPWPEPVLQSNRRCAEWADEIRKGVAAVTGVQPRETPAQSLPLPPAPRWIMPAVIATILFGPLFAFLGAEIVGNGEEHNDLVPMIIGFGVIGAALVAVLFALMASLTFTTTRWALQRGNFLGLTLPPEADSGRQQRGNVGTGIAYGTVAFYGGVALCYPMAAIVRLGEVGFVGTVFLALMGAVGAAVSIATNPEPPRGRLRIASVIGFLLSLPVVAFGVFFLYAMTQERGGWNPAVSEALLVPLFILGMFMLPWAAFRLHGAAAPVSEAASTPAAQAAINPWPRRIFLLIVLIIVLPVVLFVVMLLVPYLAWHQGGAPSPPAQASLASVSTTGNVVLMDVNVWTRDRSHTLTPNFTGPALSEQLTNSTARPGNMMLLFPTPVGKEPAVHNQFSTIQVGDRPNNYRLAFALKDPAAAKAASAHIRRSFDSMRRSKPHVRSQLFLFHLKHDDGTESYASLNFKKARRFWVLEKLQPGQTPVTDLAASRMEATKLAQEAREQVELGNLPVTISIRKLDLVNIVGEPEFDNPSTAKRPTPRVFSNRVVRAEIEIKTEPGIPAIAFNFQGAHLEAELLDAIQTPLRHSKVKPAPGISQLAYQLPRGPQPTSMLSTTMMIPLPDEAAAREVIRQLEPFREQPVERLIERNEVTGHLRFDLFDVPQTTRGPYSGWFLFAKGGPMRRLPAPFVQEPATPDKYDREQLVGSWEFSIPPLAKGEVNFADNGRFTKDTTVLMKESTSLGAWRIEGENLITEVQESDNSKEVGKINRVEIISLDELTLVTRNLNEDGKQVLSTFRKVVAPKAIDRANDTATRRTFDLRHKLASELKQELKAIVKEHEEDQQMIVSENNQSLQVNAPREVLDRAQTFVTVTDWPTKIARLSDHEYTRKSVMDAARSFFYAAAIEDDWRAFNQMMSAGALHQLRFGKPLPPEYYLDPKKLTAMDKELRETDWPDKEQKFKDMVIDLNKYPLKSLREEPGVAIGFGARYSVIATVGGRERKLKLSVTAEPRKDKSAPTRYRIDGWSVVKE